MDRLATMHSAVKRVETEAHFTRSQSVKVYRETHAEFGNLSSFAPPVQPEDELPPGPIKLNLDLPPGPITIQGLEQLGPGENSEGHVLNSEV